MGGKSSGSTQTNEPPKWAKGLFTTSAKDAQKLYDKGKGFNVYQGDRVANMTSGQQDALRTLGGMNELAGNMGYGTEKFGNLYQQAGGPSYAQQNLQNIAAGKSLMGDAMFQDMLDSQASKIADSANLAFSGAGRYGSGAHTGTLANEVGDFRREAILQNYAAERDRQLQANQMLDQNRLAGLGMQGDFASAEAASRQQRFNNLMQGGQTALQAGTFRQQQRQAQLDARQQAWKERDMEDWTRLGALQAAASGAAGPYGMMQTQQQQPFNPMGIIGSIFGMAMSDRRLKTDIELVGTRNGHNWYEFAYTSNPGMRFRGVMADEVQATHPDAVLDVGGYLCVDYSALGLEMEPVDV